jgi:glucokinase
VILAADIGGTKIVLATFKTVNAVHTMVERAEFSSQDCSDFSVLLSKFVKTHQIRVKSIAIGLAGPVLGRQVRLTNLSWSVDADALEKQFSCQVLLMNDLVAHSYGLLYGRVEQQVLKAGVVASEGNVAVIAAGTGLGQAIAVRTSNVGAQRYAVSPTEGGHTSFAPFEIADLDFSNFLFRKYGGHVSVERVVSGIDGFQNLLAYHLEKNPGKANQPVAALLGSPDIGGQMSVLAQKGDQDALLLMNQFFKFYGAEAGNLCLKSMATGGLYICGGIAAKNVTQLLNSSFFSAMTTKGRFSEIIGRIPVHLVTDADSAVKGAAAFAALHS